MKTLVATSSGREYVRNRFEYLKIYGLEGGDIEVIGDEGTHRVYKNNLGPVVNGCGEPLFHADGSPRLIGPNVLYNHKGRIDQQDERAAVELWQARQELTEDQIWWNDRANRAAKAIL